MVNRTKDLLTLKEYMKRYPIDYTAKSTVEDKQSWFRWLASYIIPSYFNNNNNKIPNTATYVVLPTIQEYAKIIVHRHYQKPLCSSLDNIFTFTEFKNEYGTLTCYQETITQLSEMDLWLLLGYLNHEYGVAIVNHDNSLTIIKFPGRNEGLKNSNSLLYKAQITENDKAIIKLKTTCTVLHKQVNDLQSKSEEFAQLSKEEYEEKHKPQAIYMLKKKKKVVEILERRLKTLETMETMLLKIEAAQNDIQVVEAFNMGAEMLRTLLSTEEGGRLSVSNIEETFERLQDTLEDHKEIEEAIQTGNEEISDKQLAAASTSQEELEEELNSIIKKEQKSVAITQPIDTQSELLRLQALLSSLNHPAIALKEQAPEKIPEMAS
ncbi:MAG: hypothetical protein EXX96DRAFT_574010 [Benjaminiella poitrasii]|nr:MAG: hypothetical protein EXX96DRAFT_574010 [Benjaminiella poitrasii]